MFHGRPSIIISSTLPLRKASHCALDMTSTTSLALLSGIVLVVVRLLWVCMACAGREWSGKKDEEACLGRDDDGGVLGFRTWHPQNESVKSNSITKAAENNTINKSQAFQLSVICFV